MQGDERVRFCGECKKNVYNVAAMTREQATALLFGNETVCARFFRRADGTILTADCPVGAKKKLRRRIALGVGAGVAFAATGAMAAAAPTMGEAQMVQGATAIEIETAMGTVAPPAKTRPFVLDEQKSKRK